MLRNQAFGGLHGDFKKAVILNFLF